MKPGSILIGVVLLLMLMPRVDSFGESISLPPSTVISTPDDLIVLQEGRFLLERPDMEECVQAMEEKNLWQVKYEELFPKYEKQKKEIEGLRQAFWLLGGGAVVLAVLAFASGVVVGH
jgi:hypothetical protein